MAGAVTQEEFDTLSAEMARVDFQIDAADMMIPAAEAYARIDAERAAGTQNWFLRRRKMGNALLALEKLGYTISPRTQ